MLDLTSIKLFNHSLNGLNQRLRIASERISLVINTCRSMSWKGI